MLIFEPSERFSYFKAFIGIIITFTLEIAIEATKCSKNIYSWAQSLNQNSNHIEILKMIIDFLLGTFLKAIECAIRLLGWISQKNKQFFVMCVTERVQQVERRNRKDKEKQSQE